MKNLKLFFLCMFIAVLTACGQQKKYISYTVKQGETIKTIAKDNGLKSKDLMRLNPDISRKPAPNTVIIIPNKNYNVTPVETEGFHTVLKKETLFSIAQKYGVSIAAIKEVNNLTGDNLSVDRIIKIPSKKDSSEETVVEEVDPNALMHFVVKDDTIYNLTKKYGITEEELLGMNPALKDGLKLGMNLKVGEISTDEFDEELNLFADEITNKPLNVLLMLPYKLNSIDVYDEEFEWKNRLLNIVTDFHAGALIAVDSLRRQGMQVSLDVVDTENSTSKVSAILRSRDFNQVDVVIGPLFLKHAKQVSKEIENVPVIAPIFSKSQTNISGNNLTKVAPNKNLLEAKMVNHLLKSFKDEKIIIVGDNSSASGNKIGRLIAKLKTNDSINDITVLKPIDGYIAKERFIEVIDTIQKKNWIVLVSDDNIVTNDVVNNLGVMPLEKRDIQLFSARKGTNFENVSNIHLARLKFTYAAVEFNDVLSTEVRSFQEMYKRKNHIRPSNYANRGFDVMYDTLLRLANSASFNEGANQGVSERVMTKFDYKKRLFGSTENNGIFLVQFQENLELISLE